MLFSAFWFACCIYMLLRNQDVYNYRIKLLDKINVDDADGMNKLNKFQQGPTYHEMMCKFWKPVDKFFNEDELLK